MHRSQRGIWTLVLALALLTCAPSHVRPVWADPGGSIGADPGGPGGGESGDPDQPQGSGKGGSGGATSPGGSQLGMTYTPTVYTMIRLKGELYLYWIQMAIRTRGW